MDSTASPNDLLQRLSAAIERLGAAQNHQPAPAATGSGQFGLPAAWPAPISPMGPPALGAMPQPAGVSVPVTVPLPDGRELSVRVHFGPEAAANLAATAAAVAQMFGQFLQARAPYGGRGGYGGYGQGGGYYGRGGYHAYGRR